MSWEDDVLAAYEHNKTKAEAEDRLRSQRAQMIEERHEQEWAALKEAVSVRCIDINARSGRLIMESTDHRPNHLTIRREDGHMLRGEYTPKTHTVLFSSETLVYVDDSFELTVRPINGVERVVWLHLEKKSLHHAQDISKAVVAKFLRAGFM
ncbi:MAG: hypothetical protein WCF17_22960 [Terracidiphilus sp.]